MDKRKGTVGVHSIFLFQAKSSDDAEEGLLFMQEMIELSKLQQEQPENPPRVVSFQQEADGQSFTTTIQAGPAQFGLDLKGDVQVSALDVLLLYYHHILVTHPIAAPLCLNLSCGLLRKGSLEQ